MIFNEAFMKKIKEFGLNSYEAKIWVALLSRGVSTAGELSDIANVPRSRSYDILESLEKKGFIIMKLGKPIKYLAIPPEEVIERVKRKVQEEAAEAEKNLDEIKRTDLLKELKSLHSQGVEMIDPNEMTGAIKGRNNLYNQLITIIKSAEEEVIIITTENGLKRKIKALKRPLKKAYERGVKIIIAASISKETRKELGEELKEIEKIAEVKNVDIEGRLAIADQKEILFMLVDDEVHQDYDTAVWMNAPFLAKTIRSLIGQLLEEKKELKN